MAIKAVSYLFVILIVVFIAACSGSSSTTTNSSLKFSSWELFSLIELGQSTTLVKPTIKFSSGGRVEGFGGCNNFSGKYKINGESLTLSDIVLTDLACENSPVESAFIQALQKTSSYKIEGSNLYLYSNGVLEAVLKK